MEEVGVAVAALERALAAAADIARPTEAQQVRRAEGPKGQQDFLEAAAGPEELDVAWLVLKYRTALPVRDEQRPLSLQDRRQN